MKLSSGKVTPELARKLGDLIDTNAEALGLNRNDLQGALYSALQRTKGRVGVATAQRLMRDPAALIRQHLETKEAGKQEHVANLEKRKVGLAKFEANRLAMVQRMIPKESGLKATDTLAVMDATMPGLMNFAEAKRLAALVIAGGNVAPTIVDLKPDRLVLWRHGAGTNGVEDGEHTLSPEQVENAKEFAESNGRLIGDKIVLGPGERFQVTTPPGATVPVFKLTTEKGIAVVDANLETLVRMDPQTIAEKAEAPSMGDL